MVKQPKKYSASQKGAIKRRKARRVLRPDVPRTAKDKAATAYRFPLLDMGIASLGALSLIVAIMA